MSGVNSWQSVRAEVLHRIRSREWAPGDAIPHEADLAQELGCARATVNRALRDLAESGLIERRRRAGSRVALHPVRKATLEIPVIRMEIESRGEAYDFSLISCAERKPPPTIRARFKAEADVTLLHVVGLHMANGQAHALEDRWIDARAVPFAATTDFSKISPNEWLVLTVPFEGGDIAFSAAVASPDEAETLNCPPGAPLFVTERTTWRNEITLTSVRLLFAPGYRLHTRL
ncbi:GntR family transcriptional regulator [Seohaeicola nanhaiensis]|uniref:GntR family transcriptional regulator n=1 Tax=Seohaeicola nanhaiensis TaxID=1387282 RepID=A0ABV9KE87_9RHOB